MKTKRTSFLARTAMTLLFTVLTTVTTWADPWPSYITNVVLVGGTESEAQSAKSGYSGYTWCSKSLNDGTSGDVIYIGYKTGNSANTNGGYITDFIVVDAVDHNPPSTISCNGHTYYLCPADGGDYFANSNHGNLTSHASLGWNIYLYYTKEHFSDKRAVSSIAINDTKSGAIDCYKKDGTLLEKNISLNRGVQNTPYVYMHIYTETKVNRPYPEPTTISGLTYDGTSHQLIPSNYDSDYSGDVYFRLGTTGSYTDVVNSITATNAGTYTIYYYSGESYYGNSSVDYAHTMTATIAKSPNSGLTVSCSNYLEGTAPVPSLVGNNLSTGTITYKYNTSQNGEYTTTKPTAPGTYWVKATIAGDSNCFEYTTAPVSFTITYNWKLHNSGDTEDDAYVISTTTDLKYLAVWVNLGNNFEGKFFKLGDNIAFDKSKENNFTPIGNSTYSFTGTFDGQGHTISGLNINKPDKDNVGLFGNTEEATIKNLIVDNSTINGKMSTGAIVGHSGNFVTVTNCRVTNSVTVSGTSQVGGITGVSSTVSGCVSAAAVSGSSFVGGIIGNGNFSSIANNLYTGTSINCPDIYKGAIVGEINGYTTLTANYYTADLSYKATANNNDTNGACRAVAINTADGVTVTPTGDATVYNVSGITGYADNNGIKYTVGNSTKYYAGATETVSLDITYGIDGFSVLGYTDGVGSPATDLTLVSDNTYTLTMTADAPTVTPVTQNLWGVSSTHDGSTADKAYIITTTEGLDLLASKVNSGTNYEGKFFELGADITYDKTKENNFTTIGGREGGTAHWFHGTFDGKGHTISGINISNTSGEYQAIFGFVNGTIKNLVVSDCHIEAHQYIGGIAVILQTLQGSIENCHVLSDVTLKGYRIIGGIAAENDYANIKGCTCAATITGTKYDGTNTNHLGGITGYTSALSGETPTLKDNLFTGTISGDLGYAVGAIIGENSSNGTTLTNNFYTCSGIGGVNGSDTNGATFAYEYPAANAAIGAAVSTYAAGTDYEGITVYENGQAYNGKFYSPNPWGGNGTEEDPFVICDTAGLDLLASDVNSGNVYAGKYFELGADITYDGSENNFTPIGDNYHRFSGHFDGKGHKVSGININQPSGFSAGLFGFIESGSVKNLTLTNSTIIGYNPVSGIVGSANGTTIENCHVASDVTINGTADNVGAIAGYLYTSTVRGCTSAATVSGTQFVGGIVGVNNSSTIQDCLYTGTSVTASGTTVGTIVGYNEGGDAKLTNNYHTCSGMGGVGGVDSSDVDGAQFAVSSETMPDDFGDVTKTYGESTYIGVKTYGSNGLEYGSLYYFCGGTEKHPYVIRTTAELDKLASDVNCGNVYAGKYFELGADITYDGSENNFTPIGDNYHRFSGHFDGKGHKVSGININQPSGFSAGLFGFIESGSVKNLTLTNSTIIGYNPVSGIVGSANGTTIENCHVASDVTINGTADNVGAIAGYLYTSTVRGCTSAATVSGTQFVGGIVGVNNSSTIQDCLYTGTSVTASGTTVGTIVGYNEGGDAKLTNNYHTCSGMGGVGGVDSKDKDGATFAYEYSAANAAMGAVGSTYGTGDYTGITAYENGLAYNGKFYSTSPWGGSGTAEDPYIIINTAGLDKLASDVSGGNRYKDTYFELGADITYDGSENNFTPIGEDGYWFYGTFDGKGHTISGIRISDTNGIFKAIFGYVCGTIKNLVVSDCRIEARQYIGGIAGALNRGTIENCHVLNDVTLSGYSYVGGIAANLEGGTVIGCTSAATITGTTVGGGKAYFLGGISGNASGNGEDSPTLTDNLFTGTISGDLYDYIGAIVGKNNSTGTTLTNNYHTCSGLGGVGDDGIVIGSDEDGKAEFAVSSTTEPDEATIGTAGTPYAAGETYQGITPYTKGLFYNGLYYYKDPNTVAWTGKGTETDPYVIRTTAELDLLASRVNGDNKYRGKYFELGADITYDGSENNFTPIGENGYSFYGTFDGKGHTISGIRISDKDGTHKAIFGRVGGTVKNLVVSDCSIEGNIYVGGIVGLLYGTIENCHVGSNVTLTGYMLIGGIAGDLEGGTIIGCTSAARITGTKDGGNNARYLGGIAGLAFIYGEHSPTLTDNLFTGTISGDLDESIGAIVGGNDSYETTLTNNYHTCSGMGGVGSEGTATGSDEDGALLAVSSTTKPDEATIGTAGTPYAAGETYQGITPYSKGLYYDGRYYWHEAFLRGDANGDGQVTITDAVAVVNYILGNPSENFNKAAANVNGDTDEHGEPIISITDAVGVVNIILNGAASTPAFTAPALTAPEDDDASPVDPE